MVYKFADDVEVFKRNFDAGRPNYLLQLSGMRVRRPDPDYYQSETRTIKLPQDTCCVMFNYVIDKIFQAIENQMDDAAASTRGQRIVKVHSRG